MGAFQLKNGHNRSHFTLAQKSESQQSSRSQIAPPMMALCWNTNFASNFCEVIVRKDLKILETFLLKGPWLYVIIETNFS